VTTYRRFDQSLTRGELSKTNDLEDLILLSSGTPHATG
jgi:hypothetical protein